MTAYASTPSELVVYRCPFCATSVFKPCERYKLLTHLQSHRRFIMNVSTSLVVLCLLHDIIWVIPCQINKTAQFQINVSDAYLLSNPLFCRVC